MPSLLDVTDSGLPPSADDLLQQTILNPGRPPARTAAAPSERPSGALVSVAEPIPGYRLVSLLGQGTTGDVWQCEAPGGIHKAIKLVRGCLAGTDTEGKAAASERSALQHVKQVRHPFLLGIERVEVVAGQLWIVMELADRSLAALLETQRNAGRAGIPRDQLLGYLREAAEALDLLGQRCGLQHVAVEPGHLFLVCNHIKVGGFRLLRPVGENRAGDAPGLYAAPEALGGRLDLRSTQYSLALVYRELLTGVCPGAPAELPEVSSLPAGDRAAALRALSADPRQRFSSCTEFIQALRSVPTPPEMPRPGSVVAASERPGSAPVPAAPGGYRFLECLSRGPVGEVWRAQEPGGPVRQARLVGGLEETGRKSIAELTLRWRALTHPAVVPLELVPCDPSRLLLLSDLVRQTLWDRFREHQLEGRKGIPRRELLGHLRVVAEALDALARQHGMQHLGLNPRLLVLVEDQIRIADFGLLQLLWTSGGQSLGELNARYAAPELFEGKISRGCDQYSLAVIYQELLTGAPPFRVPGRQRAGSRGVSSPDLDLVPAPERAVLARALHRDPGQRFPRCADLIEALEAAGPEPATAEFNLHETMPSLAIVPHASVRPFLGMKQSIATLVQGAAGVAAPQEWRGIRYLLEPGLSMRHVCRATLLPGVAPLKLAGFRQECDAQPIPAEEGSFAFLVAASRSLWQRCRGKQVGLEVHVRLGRSQHSVGCLAGVTIEVKPVGCDWDQGDQLLRDRGPRLLESVRSALQAMPERRAAERFAWTAALRVCSLFPDAKLSQPVVACARDISTGGLGFHASAPLPTPHIQIEVEEPAGSALLLAKIVRTERSPDGGYDLGAIFCPPTAS